MGGAASRGSREQPVTGSLDLCDDVLDELADDAIGVLGVFILEDFFTARFADQGEHNVIDDVLGRRGWREPVPARRCLEVLGDSTVSLHVVFDLGPGQSRDGARPPARRRAPRVASFRQMIGLTGLGDRLRRNAHRPRPLHRSDGRIVSRAAMEAKDG